MTPLKSWDQRWILKVLRDNCYTDLNVLLVQTFTKNIRKPLFPLPFTTTGSLIPFILVKLTNVRWELVVFLNYGWNWAFLLWFFITWNFSPKLLIPSYVHFSIRLQVLFSLICKIHFMLRKLAFVCVLNHHPLICCLFILVWFFVQGGICIFYPNVIDRLI